MSNKYSNPKWWFGLSMIGLPVVIFLVVLAAMVGWKVLASGLGFCVGIALTAVLLAKGVDLMMDAEYED